MKKELNDFELFKKSNKERFLLISEEMSKIHASLPYQSIFTPPAKAPHVNEDESPIQITTGDFVAHLTLDPYDLSLAFKKIAGHQY